MNTIENLNWDKVGGLMPAIVQDAASGIVLMLGYMNQEALALTQSTGLVTFFSRTRNTLWKKGETSGHTLSLVSIETDCDGDSLLVLATPHGPTCHTGENSCFGNASPEISFLSKLEGIIAERRSQEKAGSYTRELFAKGTAHIAQKVGEEAVETIVAALSPGQDPRNGGTEQNPALCEESADLLFHLLVLLQSEGLVLNDVVKVLVERHRSA